MMDGTIPKDSALYNAIQRAYKKDSKPTNIQIAIDALNRSMNSYEALYAVREITDDVYEFAMENRVREQTKLMTLLLNGGK